MLGPFTGAANYLEVVEVFKLLDLRWFDNPDYIRKKGYSRLWMIRRLRNLGASEQEMLDVYQKQVRSIMELAVPVLQAGLSQQEVKQIERVQRTALCIILGDGYLNYENALEVLECDGLTVRRYKLCKIFVRKSVKHPQFKNWFCRNKDQVPYNREIMVQKKGYHGY